MTFLRFLAEYRIPALDICFQLITLIAQETLAVAIICWFYWGNHKNLAYTLGFTYFLSGLAVQGLKVTFRIPRPWVLDPDFEPVASAVPAATGYSFPSGHTQSGTALFSSLGFFFQKTRYRLLCFAAIALIGFSRLYLGVHTPKDVFVSMALTLLISFLVFFYGRRLLNSTKHDLIISLVMVLLSVALLIYCCALYHLELLPAHEALDCIKACGAGLGFAFGFYLERRFIRFSCPRTKKEQLIKFLIGISTLLILQGGLKLLLGASFLGSFVRYLLLILWIIAGYPFLFQRIRP